MVTKIAATGYELEIVQRVVEATRALYDLPDDVSDEMAHFSDRLQEMTVEHWPVAEVLATVDVDADLETDSQYEARLVAEGDAITERDEDIDYDRGTGPNAYPPILRDEEGRPYDVG